MANRQMRLAGIAAGILALLVSLLPAGAQAEGPEAAQKAAEQMHSVRITGTRDCFFSQEETPTCKLTLEKLLSRSHGYVDRTFAEDGRPLVEFTYHLPTGTATLLFHACKQYYRMQMPQELQETVRQVTPEQAFEWLFASGEFRKVGPQEVQGVQAIGFEVSNLPERLMSGLSVGQQLVNFFFPIERSSTCIWVNPEARLPVQLEAEVQVRPCFMTGYQPMRLREVDARWEFEVELDSAQFLPAIPEDYQQLAVPAVSADDAADGGIS